MHACVQLEIADWNENIFIMFAKQGMDFAEPKRKFVHSTKAHLNENIHTTSGRGHTGQILRLVLLLV